MPSKDYIVLDIETQKSFKEVGRSKLEKLKISVVGIYDSLTDEYKCYLESEMMALEKRLETAELIIGFNILGFDMPVLAPYLFKPIDQYPVLDLLTDVEKARGHRASLDSIAAPTLDEKKSGDGTKALTLFKEGKWQELKDYCLQDVKLTKDIYDYGCKHGKVLFTSNWDYKTYEVPVTWAQFSEDAAREKAEKGADFPSSLF